MATVVETPPTLTKRLKAAGKELHTISDALVNARLVALFTSRELYGRALGCFYHVHKQLDSALQRSDDKTIIKLQTVLKPLYRTEAYERDLQFYLGPNWRQRVPVTAPIKAYTDHLEELAKLRPLLLLAHSHSQHLAMLSGGQIMGGLARKGMGLPEGEGTAAFEYQGKVGGIRSAYLSALDEEGSHMDDATLQRLLHEKRVSFQMNNQIIRSFRMGYLAPLKAAARLMPPVVWVVLAATLALTAALAVGTRSGRLVLATGSDNGSVSLWEAHIASGSADLQQTLTKVAHDDIVSGVAAGASNCQLASCSWDGTLRLWDCSQLLSCTGHLVGHQGAVHAVAWEPSGPSVLLSAGQDGTLKTWDARSPGSPVSSTAVGAPAFALTVPPQQPHLALVGDQLGRVSCFDSRKGSSSGSSAAPHRSWPPAIGKLFRDAVRSIACSPGESSDGLDVAVGADDGRVVLLSSTEAASGGNLAPAKVAYQAEGPVPTYIRALAWGTRGLYKGAWDASVSPVLW
ncbi:hypothetical protein N2152v2_001703 [Parachlorella kessleri]